MMRRLSWTDYELDYATGSPRDFHLLHWCLLWHRAACCLRHYQFHRRSNDSVGIPDRFLLSVRICWGCYYFPSLYARVRSSNPSFWCRYGTLPMLTLSSSRSPWWLASRGRSTRALRNLHRLGHTGEAGRKKLALIELTLAEVKMETDGVTYAECLRKSNLRRTIISIAPMSIQALSGIGFVAGYFTYYLQLAGFTTHESFRIQIAQPVLSIVGNLMAAAVIDRVGRRNLTFYGLVILTAFLLITGGLGTGTSLGMIKGTVAFILIYSWWYNVSIGSSAFPLLCEVSTSRLRVKTIAIGQALQSAINVMWQFVIPFMFNPDQANLGAKVAFIFGGLCFFCLIYLWIYQPETSGRSYQELDEMFAAGIPARKFKSYKTVAQMQNEAAALELAK